MATKPDWAMVAARKFHNCKVPWSCELCKETAKHFRAERRRVVRIVEKVQKNVPYEQAHDAQNRNVYLEACADILAALRGA